MGCRRQKKDGTEVDLKNSQKQIHDEEEITRQAKDRRHCRQGNVLVSEFGAIATFLISA